MTRYYIDADSLVFSTVAKAQFENPCEGHEGEMISEWSVVTHMFDQKIRLLKKKVGATDHFQMFVSGEDNFRYKIFPKYKVNRKGKELPMYLKELKEYAVEKWGAIHSHGAEADDYVVYYANKYPDSIVLAIDKDVINQVSNKVYNYWREEYQRVDPSHAKHFPYLQTLTGDTGDGIIGLKGIGPKKAQKLYDGTWQSVIDAYLEKDRTEEEALLNMRLVRLDQFNPETEELNLFKP